MSDYLILIEKEDVDILTESTHTIVHKVVCVKDCLNEDTALMKARGLLAVDEVDLDEIEDMLCGEGDYCKPTVLKLQEGVHTLNS